MEHPLALERYYWFDHEVRRYRYPNARTLAERFELSNRTAYRAVEFLRDRLGAPLEYDPSRKGYRYADETFALPEIRASQEELLAVLLARRLVAGAGGGFVAEAVGSLADKLLLALGAPDLPAAGLGERLDRNLSAAWPGHSPAPEPTFRAILEALLHRRVLAITYLSPQHDQPTRRDVEPHHLQHYQGSWVLTAYCRHQEDWRKFYLSRMDEVRVEDESFASRPPEEWAVRVDEAFGLFQGAEHRQVRLRFTPFRARWVREQVWHETQELSPRPDGSLDLSLPVADLREIKLKVLSFGADVEVLEPEELRAQVAEEARRLSALYGKSEKAGTCDTR
ncbi:MAG: WYL domain-containing transcriptional regulator [Thermodesulfobacteriota bacterium]